MTNDVESKPSILVIDDDEANRKVLEMILKKENFIPILASNAKIGLELVKSKKPALIVLDIFMPKEDGFSLLTKLKQNDKLRKIPVILFTILDNEESRKKAIDMGVCAYITKPFDMKEIVDVIKSNLKEFGGIK
ncbi:MAG: response regulator [Desulfobacterales bacterium]|nr:response regulator [Desulfobacterales bacterium]